MREKNSRHMRDLVRDDPSTGEHMIQQNKKKVSKDLETLLKLLGEHGIMRREKKINLKFFSASPDLELFLDFLWLFRWRWKVIGDELELISRFN